MALTGFDKYFFEQYELKHGDFTSPSVNILCMDDISVHFDTYQFRFGPFNGRFFQEFDEFFLEAFDPVTHDKLESRGTWIYCCVCEKMPDFENDDPRFDMHFDLFVPEDCLPYEAYSEPKFLSISNWQHCGLICSECIDLSGERITGLWRNISQPEEGPSIIRPVNDYDNYRFGVEQVPKQISRVKRAIKQ